MPGLNADDGMNLWSLLGLLFVGIGAVGAVLPLLPTTPFILLAAWCFARSSPRLHGWLMTSELFGPLLRDWEEKRCMTAGVRRLSLSMMVLVGGTSILFFVPTGWGQLAGLVLIGVGCATVLSIKVCEHEDRLD
ncbi:MAG: YbaN family protein [Gammaproteobacteria bacterium]|nr:YbaN family protein [Gammaproteobacteria bacterium]